MTINTWTFLVSVFFLPIWLVWELATFWLRAKGFFGGPLIGREVMTVGTISMVMQHRAYQVNVLPFFWSGMMAHWWWNDFDGKAAGNGATTFLWWALLVGTLVADVLLWNTPFNELHPVLKFYRAPMVQCVAGFVSAYFLFAQVMTRLPGWRWW